MNDAETRRLLDETAAGLWKLCDCGDCFEVRVRGGTLRCQSMENAVLIVQMATTYGSLLDEVGELRAEVARLTQERDALRSCRCEQRADRLMWCEHVCDVCAGAVPSARESMELGASEDEPAG